MKQYFKKSLLLFIVFTCFVAVATAGTKIHRVTGPDIYARVELQDQTHLAYGSYDDNWDEGSGHLVVRFYSDGGCTMPYTLTDSLVVHVKWSFEEVTNDVLTGWGDIESWDFTAYAGHNYLDLGAPWTTFQHHSYYIGYPYDFVESDINSYYSLEDPGDGSYYNMPTATL